ncbi:MULTISPECIES: hypothetical protein [unclassified Lentimicrobium]|uniref:CBU_0592 family membrane protein n=1 Tax=unclassified Lentimicrobium TaxID=2677434 RepID=UPI001554680A|nr:MULTISPECIES: hypothetical protein [unclassified Lentimicrobium]NPD48059.1 hypothetical protein [Lentimicrobium sp. S6]NPD86541.1 hypothetical protein [Lentimicrobium sp. L6]
MNHIDWIGFIGVFQILLAYILNVMGKLKKENIAFILLNLVGAAMACLASVLMDYWPFIILEGVWALVSLFSLFNYRKVYE